MIRALGWASVQQGQQELATVVSIGLMLETSSVPVPKA